MPFFSSTPPPPPPPSWDIDAALQQDFAKACLIIIAVSLTTHMIARFLPLHDVKTLQQRKTITLEHRVEAGEHAEGSTPLPSVILYSIAVLCAVRYVAPKAWLAAKRLHPDMNLLMVIAVVGAIGIGAWFEAATVSFFFALALALEAWSLGRARRAVATVVLCMWARACRQAAVVAW